MSTLKVNRIEPYTGNTITAIGLTIESASYAVTASYALNGGGGSIDTSSFITAAQTASMTVATASYASTSLTASYAINAPNAANANTASYVATASTANTATSSSYSETTLSSSYSATALSSSYSVIAETASLSLLSVTASYVSGAILNYPDADGTTPTIARMVSMTSASYAAIPTASRDINTLYIII